jgi:hypothetical protein
MAFFLSCSLCCSRQWTMMMMMINCVNCEPVYLLSAVCAGVGLHNCFWIKIFHLIYRFEGWDLWDSDKKESAKKLHPISKFHDYKIKFSNEILCNRLRNFKANSFKRKSHNWQIVKLKLGWQMAFDNEIIRNEFDSRKKVN